MEAWRDVVGYEGFYEVSDLGRVRTVERVQESYGGRRWVKPVTISKLTFDGCYMVISLSKFGIRKRFYGHELVLTAFVGARPDGLQGCHNNGDGRCNALLNLRWGTPSENNEDKRSHETLSMGEKHGMNKYSEDKIFRVKDLAASGLSTAEIAIATGVHPCTVAAVRSGRQWKHLAASL